MSAIIRYIAPMTVVGSSVDPLPSKSVMTNDRVCVGDLQNEWTKDGDNTHAYAG